MKRDRAGRGVRPLTVVIAALVRSGRILLIRRRRGDYVGLWGLPGGKIEEGEHLSEAAVREIHEESGLEAEFKGYLGIVSELLLEEGKKKAQFLLHVCELSPRTVNVVNGAEGDLDWFDLDGINEVKSDIIPSDFFIIEKMVKGSEKNYFNCVLEKTGDAHVMKEFV